jgi:hypothetical protein
MCYIIHMCLCFLHLEDLNNDLFFSPYFVEIITPKELKKSGVKLLYFIF